MIFHRVNSVLRLPRAVAPSLLASLFAGGGGGGTLEGEACHPREDGAEREPCAGKWRGFLLLS